MKPQVTDDAGFSRVDSLFVSFASTFGFPSSAFCDLRFASTERAAGPMALCASRDFLFYPFLALRLLAFTPF